MNANVLTDLRWLEYYCSPRDEGGSRRLPVSFRSFFCPSLNPSFRGTPTLSLSRGPCLCFETLAFPVLSPLELLCGPGPEDVYQIQPSPKGCQSRQNFDNLPRRLVTEARSLCICHARRARLPSTVNVTSF